jgi:hypothetical protein
MNYCEFCGSYYEYESGHTCIVPISIQEQIFRLIGRIEKLEERVKYLEQRVIGDIRDE